MSRVAIAGGTGGLGRTITEAISATKLHSVFVLSRTPSDIFSDQPSVKVLVIDYTSPTAIAAVLRNSSIDTIISALSMHTEEHCLAQLTLIEGANLSGTVVRFAPSEYGMDYVEATKVGFSFPGGPFKLRAIDALIKTRMQYTRFLIGVFMDYLNLSDKRSYLKGIALVLDIENAKAVIPGDGEQKVVLTHTSDVGQFVAAALGLQSWSEKSVIVGERINFREVVEIAEEVGGKKFNIAQVSVEDLKTHNIPELPANAAQYDFLPKGVCDAIFSAVGLAAIEGWLDVSSDGGSLNTLLPDVHPISVKQFLSGSSS